jgi:DNA polymerase-1
VINETQGMLALEVLTTQYYGFNIKELSPVNRRRLDDEQLTAVLEYNAIDAKYHRELFITQKPLLQEQGMVPVYDHTVRRIATLVLTQMRGVPVDQDEVAAFRKRYESEAKKWFDKIAELPDVQAFRKHAGHDFEPTNNHDVVKLLKQLGMPSAKSDEKVLSKIDHPVAGLILKHRKVSKLLSTYVLPVSEEHTNYLGQVVPRSEHLFSDNLLHPIISTTKVRTWRTSSEDPNVQNWPKRGPNFEIRRVVKPERGFKVLAFDYAGIQARNIAMESLDETLTQSFITGYDIHSDYVEQILKRHPKWMGGGKLLHKDEKLFKTARHKAKNGFVFPSFFGAKPTSISVGILDAPKDVVEDLQEYLWDMFPDIHKWQAKLQKFYKREGYITGLSGHRRHAPCSYNELINAPIQADESLIVLTAMSELSELDYKRYQPIMEIHDDLTFVCPAKKVDEYADVIIREMVKPRFDWIDPVPLVVEMSVGDDWANLVHVGDFENVGTKGYREINKK